MYRHRRPSRVKKKKASERDLRSILILDFGIHCSNQYLLVRRLARIFLYFTRRLDDGQAAPHPALHEACFPIEYGPILARKIPGENSSVSKP